MSSQNKYQSLDLAKFIAASIIVLIHLNDFRGLPHLVFIDFIGRLAVPFFLITSSFLFYKFKGDDNLCNFVKRLSILYFAWFAINLPFTIQDLEAQTSLEWGERIAHYSLGFFLGSTYSGSWFISSLIQGVLIITILGRYFRERILWILASLCFIYVVTTNFYFQLLPTNIQDLVATYNKFTGYETVYTFLVTLIYVVIGRHFAHNEEKFLSIKRPKLIIGLGITCALAFVEAAAVKYLRLWENPDAYFMLVPASIAIFTFVLQSKPTWTINYVFLRKASTIIFFAHFLFRRFLYDNENIYITS